MLCVLFLGARMRALQMDPKHGNPQRWAQNCFYLCTYSGFFFSFRQVQLGLPFSGLSQMFTVVVLASSHLGPRT